MRKTLQEALDEVVEKGMYTKEIAEHILEMTDTVAKKKGLYYKYTQFEVDFIIKPRIIDDLLIKCMRYKKEVGSAKTFMNIIISTAIVEGQRSVRRERSGNFSDVYYYEDIQKIANEEEEPINWSDDLLIQLIQHRMQFYR